MTESHRLWATAHTGLAVTPRPPWTSKARRRSISARGLDAHFNPPGGGRDRGHTSNATSSPVTCFVGLSVTQTREWTNASWHAIRTGDRGCRDENLTTVLRFLMYRCTLRRSQFLSLLSPKGGISAAARTWCSFFQVVMFPVLCAAKLTHVARVAQEIDVSPRLQSPIVFCSLHFFLSFCFCRCLKMGLTAPLLLTAECSSPLNSSPPHFSSSLPDNLQVFF